MTHGTDSLRGDVRIERDAYWIRSGGADATKRPTAGRHALVLAYSQAVALCKGSCKGVWVANTAP
jgi:hypothetical protein